MRRIVENKALQILGRAVAQGFQPLPDEPGGKAVQSGSRHRPDQDHAHNKEHGDLKQQTDFFLFFIAVFILFEIR